jgi:hypothetical protein
MIGERFSKSLLDEKRITKIFFCGKSHFIWYPPQPLTLSFKASQIGLGLV